MSETYRQAGKNQTRGCFMLLLNIASCGNGIADYTSGNYPGFTRKGFTLVELLVAMAVLTIVTGAALVVFRGTAAHEARQQQNLEQMKNLRAGLNTVANDARMAGNGYRLMGTQLIQVWVDSRATHETQQGTGWFRYNAPNVNRPGVIPIFGTNSSSPSTADTLTIFRTATENFNSVGQLSSGYQPGVQNLINLKDPIEIGQDISTGDIVAVTTGEVTIITQVEVTSTTALTVSGRFAPGAPMVDPSNFTFPAGSTVYNLKDVTFVTYYLDMPNLNLMANYHDTVTVNGVESGNIAVVANNIEDFQVNYYIGPNAGPTLTDSITPPQWPDLVIGVNTISGLRMGMVSRSNTKVAENLASGDPISLLGHTASADKGYSRRFLIENVNVRTIP